MLAHRWVTAAATQVYTQATLGPLVAAEVAMETGRATKAAASLHAEGHHLVSLKDHLQAQAS
jgi:hypothetical protein